MKTLKRFSLVALGCLFLITGCTAETNQSVQNKIEPLNEHHHMSDIMNLDSLIMSADNIVVGNVISEEKFDDVNTYKYTVSVKDDLKGNSESKSIDVYEAFGTLKKGKGYILILDSWEDELYPNPVYTSINKNSIIEVDQDTLIGGEELIGSKTKDELINLVKDASKVSLFSVKSSELVEKANDLAELTSLSENIIHIVPKIVRNENIYVKTVEVEVLQTFKGTIKQGKKVLHLPADIVLENEYIIFLQGDESYSLATKEGSVVSKDNDELWQEILNKFAK